MALVRAKAHILMMDGEEEGKPDSAALATAVDAV